MLTNLTYQVALTAGSHINRLQVKPCPLHPLYEAILLHFYQNVKYKITLDCIFIFFLFFHMSETVEAGVDAPKVDTEVVDQEVATDSNVPVVETPTEDEDENEDEDEDEDE